MTFQSTLINEAADDADKALASKRAEQEAARRDVEGAEAVAPIIDPPLPDEETRLEHAAAEGGAAQAKAKDVDAETKAEYRP